MPISNFDILQANHFIGGSLSEASPFGKVWYVDGTNGSDGNVGDSPTEAKATIGGAISASRSGKGDTIVIAPGTYTVTSALVPKANTTFRAAVINRQDPSVIITGNIADVVQVDVDNVRFIGLEFKAAGNTADNLVDIADSAAVAGVEFYFCTFHGDDKTSVVGIQLDDAANACNGLVVYGCLFRDLTGTAIDVGVLGMPYARIEANTFALDVNSGAAIALADTSAFATGKGYVVKDNLFTGFDATGNEVCITIAGTEDTTGSGIFTGNRAAYSLLATQDKLDKAFVFNHYGDGTSGGALFDPSA